MSVERTYVRPTKQMAWCAPGFAIWLLATTLMPFPPKAHWAFVFVQAFPAIPLIGSLLYLRSARHYRLTVSSQEIVVSSPGWIRSYQLDDPNLVAEWIPGREKIVLTTTGSTTTVRPGDYEPKDALDVLREFIPLKSQHHWEDFEAERTERSEKSRRFLRYSGPLLGLVAVPMIVVAIATRQWHFLVLAAVHAVIGGKLYLDFTRPVDDAAVMSPPD